MKPWENKIRRIVPYVPGEQPNLPDMVKLNTNENPYPPAPGVRKVLQEMDTDKLRLYPDPTSRLLVEELADYYHLDKDMVFVGVGSDDVLAMAFMSFFQSDKPILFPDITYSFYPVWCDLFRIPYRTPALDEEFCLIKEDYYQENGGIILANPNAPTGTYEDLSFIEDILSHNRNSIVIIDEAYVDFAGRSAIELIPKYDNLLVIQTFSKARSMAGMRIGYAMGNPELIKILNDVKYAFNSYTMNHTAILAGAEAVKDSAYFLEGIRKIKETRAWAEKEFEALGFSFPESGANFLFVTHKYVTAKELLKELREHHIYVRHFTQPRINNYLRISIGTKEEMEKLFACIKNYLTINVK